MARLDQLPIVRLFTRRPATKPPADTTPMATPGDNEPVFWFNANTGMVHISPAGTHPLTTGMVADNGRTRPVLAAGLDAPVVVPITTLPAQHREAAAVDDITNDRQAAVDEAIRVIQHHLDLEAGNRRLTSLDPRDLCPMQKAEMIQDLTRLLRKP